jgi:V/A-type H+-transporting ATPase subunit E
MENLLGACMSILSSSQDKLQHLCELLKGQALEPAHEQAQKIVEDAKAEASKMIEEAMRQSKLLLDAAKAESNREKEVTCAALKQAGQQAIGRLRQEIETELVNKELTSLVRQTVSSPVVVVDLLKKYLEMLHEKGWDKDFSVEISKLPEAKELAGLIAAECSHQLKEGRVLSVLPEGGIRLKLHDRKMTLDASESAVCELLGQFLRKDLRTRLFL